MRENKDTVRERGKECEKCERKESGGRRARYREGEGQ